MKFDDKRSAGLNNDGFVLVWALLLMVVVLILGISGIGSSVFDSLISGNSALHKQSFYQADGGAGYGEGLVYQNAICSVTSGGFTDDGLAGSNTHTITNANSSGSIIVYSLNFAQNIVALTSTLDRYHRQAAYYPQTTASDALPHTNLYSITQFKEGYGHGNLMVSGYLGPARGGVSGSMNLYTIATRNVLTSSSSTRRATVSGVTVQWQLDLGVLNGASSSDCLY